MSGADPLRSGAIFRVADVSILRQSPAPRLSHQSPPAFAVPAPPAFVERTAPLQPAPPGAAAGNSLMHLLARNVAALSAPIKRDRSPSPPRDPPPPPEPVAPKVSAPTCTSAAHLIGRGPLASFSVVADR